MENAILLSLLGGKGFLKDVSGWKKGAHSSLEVDFVIKESGLTMPLEVKASLKHNPRASTAVETYLALTQQKLGMVVSAASFYVDETQLVASLDCQLISVCKPA
jgi:predicted AAA+ superfamily ATPase